MKTTKIRLISITVLCTLILSSLACRLTAKTSEKPVETIAVSMEAVGSLEEKVQEAVDQAAQGQTVELSLTEEEITSLLVQKLNEQREVMVSDPQVHLRDDKVQLFGKVQYGNFTLPLDVVLEPRVDTAGRANLKIVTVKMGLISAPDSIVSNIQDQANSLVNDFLQQSGESFYVESITSRDGLLTIRGHRP